MKTKDGLLKTEDILLKTKDGCTFFLMGRSRIRMAFNKDQISSLRAIGRGMRGMGGESLNEGCFVKFPLLSKIQTLSQKL